MPKEFYQDFIKVAQDEAKVKFRLVLLIGSIFLCFKKDLKGWVLIMVLFLLMLGYVTVHLEVLFKKEKGKVLWNLLIVCWLVWLSNI
jgi:hypothetical protein